MGFIGFLYFSLYKIRIVSVLLDIIRKETFTFAELSDEYEETVKEFEVMDGSPVRGTLIPIRFYTGDLHLWPQPKDKYYVIEYFLRVHAVDESNGSYIKMIPINFVFPK